jgi:limonene-1,2-epoxide hydrolase
MAIIDLGATASRSLTAWASGNPDAARSLFTDDVVVKGPLGETHGADEYLRGVRRRAGSVEGVDVKKTIVDGDDVCLVYELQSASGPLPTVGWYHFRDDKIDAVRTYFDPRPLVDEDSVPSGPTFEGGRMTSWPDIPLFAAGLQLCETAD